MAKSDLMRFPKETYWSWLPVVKEKELIKPGGVLDLFSEEKDGWLYYVRLVSTNPDIEVNIDVFADRMIEISETIRSLKEAGYAASQLGFRILTYDDFNSIYSVEYAPGMGGFPGVPFRGKNRAYLVNKGNVDAYVWFTGWLIEVK